MAVYCSRRNSIVAKLINSVCMESYVNIIRIALSVNSHQQHEHATLISLRTVGWIDKLISTIDTVRLSYDRTTERCSVFHFLLVFGEANKVLIAIDNDIELHRKAWMRLRYEYDCF